MQWMGYFVGWMWRIAKVIGLNIAKPVFVPITQREPSLLNEIVFIGIEGSVLCIYYAFIARNFFLSFFAKANNRIISISVPAFTIAETRKAGI